ncbi:cupin [Croceicoccus naphthovorans]|uniref:Cupin n=1 Tax=Croceicoccus naphthovorans TaxID=1348774 RepID=A0A0G3XJB3_9SPHN|nr:cupin [Croceicoccus naphthovorans]
MDADSLIEALHLAPHPEGGWFRETWREPSPDGGRDLATGILFLLKSGEHSYWHRVDASEMWIYNAGAPLVLRTSDDAVTLGSDVMAGQLVQHPIPPHQWQAAETTGDWTLVTCIVAPGFDFAGFELAPPGWQPPSA